MYKQNDKQTLMNTKVIPSEHDTKSSLHLCKKNILAYYTRSVFLTLHLNLTIFFSVIVNISCNLSIKSMPLH